MIIRDEQMRDLGQAMLHGLEDRLLDHIRERFPRQYELFGELLRPIIRRVIEKSRAYGMVSESSATIYLDVTLLMGYGFDEDPQIPDLGAILTGDYANERLRATDLYQAAAASWKSVGGNDGQLWSAAFRRFDGLRLAAIDDPVQSWSRELGRLYPTKWAAIQRNRATLGALQLLAGQSAGRLRLTGNEAVLLIGSLMLLAGSAVLEDPRFNWLPPILGDSGLVEPVRIESARAESARRFALWFGPNT